MPSFELTADQLIARRKALGLSQRGLARALNLSPSTIGRWERSDSRVALPEWLDLTVTRLETGHDAYEPTAKPASGVEAAPELSVLSRLHGLPNESSSFI